jgi:hypothetical protein
MKNALPLSVLLVDNKNIVIEGNTKIEDLLGVPIAALKGKSLDDITQLQKTALMKTTQHQQTSILHFSTPITIGEEEKIIHFECAPLHLPDTETPQGKILFLQDETEKQQLHEQLQEQHTQYATLKKEFTKISQQYLDVQSELSTIQSKLNNKQCLIETLSTNLTSMQSSLSSKEQELQSMHHALSENQQRITRVHKHLQQLFPGELNELPQVQIDETLTQNLKEKNAGIQQLEHQLNDMKTHLHQVLSAYDTTKEQLRIKDELLHTTEEQLTKANQHIHHLDTLLQEAQTDNRDSSTKNTEPMTMKIDQENLIIPLAHIEEVCNLPDQSQAFQQPTNEQKNNLHDIDAATKVTKKEKDEEGTQKEIKAEASEDGNRLFSIFCRRGRGE